MKETSDSFDSLDLEFLEKYAYADLAAGKDARTRVRTARQCIVCGARDWFDRWFFLYIWAGRLTTSEFRDKILETQRNFGPRLFGLEANGMQVLFGNLIREEAKQDPASRTRMIPVYQPTNVDKNFRIRTGLEPVILQGRLFLPADAHEARAEIRGFPTAATKDIVDSIETCIRMAPKRPINRRRDSEIDDYARYLRNSGCPAHLIKEKLENFVPFDRR